MFATIYYSYHEETRLCSREVDHGILLYRRYIDDVFVLQKQIPGSHARFLNDMNSFGPLGRRLEWISSGPSEEVTFLDLNLRIQNGIVKVRTHEKPLNLHLYIPAHSAHSPSIAKSLIYGQLRRFWLQNSETEDYKRFVGNFFNYLVDRGYDREILKPLFLEASLKLTENPALKSNASDEEKRAFLHLKFHPFQISRMDIQNAFRRNCADVLK